MLQRSNRCWKSGWILSIPTMPSTNTFTTHTTLSFCSPLTLFFGFTGLFHDFYQHTMEKTKVNRSSNLRYTNQSWFFLLVSDNLTIRIGQAIPEYIVSDFFQLQFYFLLLFSDVVALLEKLIAYVTILIMLRTEGDTILSNESPRHQRFCLRKIILDSFVIVQMKIRWVENSEYLCAV